jgi:NADH:ubiquinone oxidoreductase subunit 2 (subunit N)
VLTTVVSAGYYMYVVMLMFMRPRPASAPVPEASGGLTRMILAISVGLILILGIFPEQAIAVARLARPRVEMLPQASAAPPPSTLVAHFGSNRRTTGP